jgi:hypothetical protein
MSIILFNRVFHISLFIIYSLFITYLLFYYLFIILLFKKNIVKNGFKSFKK